MRGKLKKINVALLIVVGLHLVALANVSFTPWPELHLWPYLMNHGYKLYQDIAFEKPPLVPNLLFLWFKVFGNTLFSLKALTWGIIISTDILIFSTAQKIHRLGRPLSFLALGIYAIINVGFSGNGFWFDLLLAPLYLSCYYLIESNRFMAAGVVLGLSLITKQNAIFALIPILFSLYKHSKNRDIKLLVKGAGLIIATCILAASLAGTFSSLFKWTINFAPTLASMSLKLPNFKESLVICLFLLPILFVSLSDIHLFLWGIISVSLLFPRFELFHLQTLAVFTALSLAKNLKGNKKINNAVFSILPITLLFVISMKNTTRVWKKSDRFYEDSTLSMASWIKLHTRPGEKILLLNTWDHLYKLSNTLPATTAWYPYLAWYLSDDKTQSNFITTLSHNPPRIIVSEGLSESPRNLIEVFLRNNFRSAGVIDNRFTIWEPK